MSRRLDLLIERARRVLEERQKPVETDVASEIAVFDFDQTLHNKYKPLPLVDQFIEYKAAGVPCYIVTARKKNTGQEAHIKDTCKRWGIKINQKDIFVTQDDPKGPVVRKLIDKHQAERCMFWDDKEENCESVYDSCYDACEELKIYWLSAAIPGDIRKEITSDEYNERSETKPTLKERKLFRNWRRLSGV